jgi:hypothetical protein
LWTEGEVRLRDRLRNSERDGPCIDFLFAAIPALLIACAERQ